MTKLGDACNSQCGTYQYWLTRPPEPRSPLMFVMLNPSIADEYKDDPTVRKCRQIANREGFDGILLLNLYAYIDSNPRALEACSDPVGPENDAHLRRALTEQVQRGAPVVAGWGSRAERRQVAQRVGQVLNLVSGVDWQCLGYTQLGYPLHPMQRGGGDLRLRPFDVSAAVRRQV